MNDKRIIDLAKRDITIPVEGVGTIGNFKKVYYCPDADVNFCGTNVMCALGYSCQFFSKNFLIRDIKLNMVEAVGSCRNGLYFIDITDLLTLGGTDVAGVAISQKDEQIQLLHERLELFSHSTIYERCRNCLFEGISLTRECFNKTYKFPRACT